MRRILPEKISDGPCVPEPFGGAIVVVVEHTSLRLLSPPNGPVLPDGAVCFRGAGSVALFVALTRRLCGGAVWVRPLSPLTCPKRQVSATACTLHPCPPT